MEWSMGLTAAFAILGFAYLAVVRRSIRMMRGGDEDWVQHWRSLSRGRRRAISRTMRRGEPVLDPDDAELALRAVAQTDHVHDAIRPLRITTDLILAAMLAIGILVDIRPIVIVAALGFAFSLVAGALARWQRRRFHRSAEATRQITEL